MPRRTFTERMVLTVLLKQSAKIICPRCNQPLLLGQQIDREHFHEIALGGADDVTNCFYSHKECHDTVTNGTKWTSAGSSKHKIAKSKRMIAARTQPKKETSLARKCRWAKQIKAERGRNQRSRLPRGGEEV
jgi:hypothetical protein